MKKTVTTGATAFESGSSPNSARICPKAGSIMSMARAVSAMSIEMSTMNSRLPMSRLDVAAGVVRWLTPAPVLQRRAHRMAGRTSHAQEVDHVGERARCG